MATNPKRPILHYQGCKGGKKEHMERLKNYFIITLSGSIAFIACGENGRDDPGGAKKQVSEALFR